MSNLVQGCYDMCGRVGAPDCPMDISKCSVPDGRPKVDNLNRVLMACALLLLVVAVALLSQGCSHQSGAYDLGPPGAGHWRPAPVTTDDDGYSRAVDVLAANGPRIVTVEGKLSHHGLQWQQGGLSGGPDMGDEHTHAPFRLLPSGRVATPCCAADLWWTDRECVVDGRWLVLDTVCQVYDEASDTVIWGVARSRPARR